MDFDDASATFRSALRTRAELMDDVSHTLANTSTVAGPVRLPKGWLLTKGRHSGSYICGYHPEFGEPVFAIGDTGRAAAQALRRKLRHTSNGGI